MKPHSELSLGQVFLWTHALPCSKLSQRSLEKDGPVLEEGVYISLWSHQDLSVPNRKCIHREWHQCFRIRRFLKMSILCIGNVAFHQDSKRIPARLAPKRCLAYTWYTTCDALLAPYQRTLENPTVQACKSTRLHHQPWMWNAQGRFCMLGFRQRPYTFQLCMACMGRHRDLYIPSCKHNR